jgi:hypothetical protein
MIGLRKKLKEENAIMKTGAPTILMKGLSPRPSGRPDRVRKALTLRG